MTVAISPVVKNTDSFIDWLNKTNIAFDVLSNYAVTTNSNTATGNASITGTFSAGTLRGSIAQVDTIRTSNANTIAVTSNVSFSANVSLGFASNITILGANTTHNFLTVDTATQKLLPTSLITEILLIDGAGSGIDSDLLDGENGGFYLDMGNMVGSVNASQHGIQTDPDLHQLANTTVHGFMSSTMASKLNSINSNATVTVQAGTNAANTKDSIVDADQVVIQDSAASNAIKRITWANIKTVLGSIYATIANPTFTGNVVAPTLTSSDSSTKVATTAFVKSVTDPIGSQVTTLTSNVSTLTTNLNTLSTNTSNSFAALGSIVGRSLTISTADPSGGNNGDIWFKVP